MMGRERERSYLPNCPVIFTDSADAFLLPLTVSPRRLLWGLLLLLGQHGGVSRISGEDRGGRDYQQG